MLVFPQESVRFTKVLGLAPSGQFGTRTSVVSPWVAESAEDRESVYRMVLGPIRSSRGHVVGLSKTAWYGLNPIEAPGGTAWDPGGLPQGQGSMFRYVCVWCGGWYGFRECVTAVFALRAARIVYSSLSRPGRLGEHISRPGSLGEPYGKVCMTRYLARHAGSGNAGRNSSRNTHF